jgi:hypothetical protein
MPIKHRMSNGSLHFLSLPEKESGDSLRKHLASLPGAEITEFVTDQVREVWIYFSFRGQEFTLNNKWGEYWFCVRDPSCPESVLEEIALHCSTSLRGQ